MIGERRTGKDLGDGGRGLMLALFRDMGGERKVSTDSWCYSQDSKQVIPEYKV